MLPLSRKLCALGLLAAVSGTGCAADLDAGMQPVDVEQEYFECKVQPLLTKSCSMFACHGDGRRYLRIYARNRLRYGGTEDDRNDPIRADEVRMNYLAARAMVSPGDPDDSLLLRKPLDERGGGYFHRGATLYKKGNVFLDRDDPDYAILRDWVNGASYRDDPRCKALFDARADAGTDAASEDAGP